MYSATKENNCQTNELGEFYLNNDLDMTPTEEGNLAAYTVQVKADCVDSDEALDLRAYCFFEY